VAESHSDEQLLKRNDLNVIRYGVVNQTTAQK
jgi:hypothetical protein